MAHYFSARPWQKKCAAAHALKSIGPHGQHCDHYIHTPTRWSTLPSHVPTRPPPPPLESEASEVASRHSYSGLAQQGQLTSCHKLCSPESGDYIPRRSSWFGDVSDLKGSRWGSMTGSSGSLRGQEGWILHTPPLYTLLGPVSSAHSTTVGPIRAFADSRAEVTKKMKTLLLLALAFIKRVGDISVDDLCLEFGPADSQIILRPGYVPEVPTTPFRARWWACKRCPGGGGLSPSFALSCPSIEMLRWQDAKLQDLRPALCLPRRPAEGESHLNAEDGPLDSGRHQSGLSGTGCALPVQVESSL